MRTFPKILLVAEAANPDFVSVPLIGWSVAKALRDIADVHIVTQVRNREAFVRFGLEEGKDFTAINSEAVARPLWKMSNFLRMGEGKGWTTVQAVNALSYLYFEMLLWRRFRMEIEEGKFDIVHRITPLSPTQPSIIASRCRKAQIPFIIGPLNGGVPWPKGYDAERRREREWLSYLRNAYKLLPSRRSTLECASAILVGSRHTQKEIPAEFQSKCFYMPENGIDTERFNRYAKPASHRGPMKVCFVGRMVPYKGPDILLDAALPLLRDGRVTLEMVGDGPLLSELQAYVKRKQVEDKVRFHGWLEHQKIQDILATCDLLGFPSIREFGGGVVLEAMALGVPPLVVDYAGPGELVSEGRGFKVQIAPRQALINELREALEEISVKRENLSAVGSAARAWVLENFTWQKKAKQIFGIYEWILGYRHERPAFFL